MAHKIKDRRLKIKEDLAEIEWFIDSDGFGALSTDDRADFMQALHDILVANLDNVEPGSAR